MAYITKKPEYIKKKERKTRVITKKKKNWITPKEKRDPATRKSIIDTAKEAADFIKREFPKIGIDY